MQIAIATIVVFMEFLLSVRSGKNIPVFTQPVIKQEAKASVKGLSHSVPGEIRSSKILPSSLKVREQRHHSSTASGSSAELNIPVRCTNNSWSFTNSSHPRIGRLLVFPEHYFW